MPASAVSRAPARELLLAIAIGAGAFLVAMIPGLILARNITRGLNKLSAGIRRFQSGEHQVQVQVSTAMNSNISGASLTR